MNRDRFARLARARKILRHLDINTDGIVSADELHAVKGRLYRPLHDATATGAGGGKGKDAGEPEFLENLAAARQFEKTTATYLKHRTGYILCCVHFVFLGVVMAVLALQNMATLE